MRGYQADIDGQNRYTGQNYEEKGRLFLAHARPGDARGRRAQADRAGHRRRPGGTGEGFITTGLEHRIT